MLGLAQFRRNLALHDDTRVNFHPETAPGSTDRIFVLVPHCDDETLGVGGFIHAARRAGAAVEVAFTTNGDGSRSMQIAENTKRLRHNTFLDLAKTRQREALAACELLGVGADHVRFLGFPDRGTGQMWLNHWHNPYFSTFTRAAAAPYPNATTPHAPYSGAQMLADVRALLARFQPTHLFTTHPGDTHPDHWASWAFALAALETLRQDPDHAWAERCKLRAFMVHRGVWPAPHGYLPRARLAPPADLLHGGPARRWTEWQLDGPALAAKKAALLQHDSQMIWTPLYLRGFLRRNELFEAIDPAGAGPDGEAAPRGVSLVSTTPETIVLRVHLRQAIAPRGACFLYVRAIAGGEIRSWNVELHAREKHAHASGEPFPARARESRALAAKDNASTWQARHVEAGQTPKTAARPGAAAGTSFDLEITRADLGGPGNLSLIVSATSRLGKTTLEHTEIGAVRLEDFQGSPLLVARSDPRYSAYQEARRTPQKNEKRSA